MDKKQGATIGAVLLAGLMLRPLPSGQSVSPAVAESSHDSYTSASSGGSQGPWIASCKYWAPVRKPEERSDSTSVSGIVSSTGNDLDWQVKTASNDDELGCRHDDFERWGLPTSGPPIDITALIATVPDPVHTHLALAFDRTIDSLLQAAADIGYSSSYYWLPWRNRIASGRATEVPTDMEPGHSAQREQQPGLIILKHLTDDPATLNTVIYIFLVAESPTQGADGDQLKTAFICEDNLLKGIEQQNRTVGRGDQFHRGRGDEIALIGPTYSGSAASLRAGIESIRRESNVTWRSFSVTGLTSTRAVQQVLTKDTPDDLSINYRSFGNDQCYQYARLVERLTASGVKASTIALLVEDNTALGNYSVYSDRCGMPLHDAEAIQTIRFSREISLLRNIEPDYSMSDSDEAGGPAAQSPYLRLTLKDSRARDSVTQFSRDITPLSLEAQLMTIARHLHRFRVQVVGILASDILDAQFLARFVHRISPDTSLVFFDSDLLYVREADDIPFVGAITVTPYHLIGMRQGDAPARRAYTDSTSVSYYNATLFTLQYHTRIAVQNRTAFLYYDYKSAPAETESALVGLQPNDLVVHPLLWATVIGLDGYYPLAYLNPCASDADFILPPVAYSTSQAKTPAQPKVGGTDQPCIDRPVSIEGTSSVIELYPSQIWTLLSMLIILLCVLHGGLLLTAEPNSSFGRDLAIEGNNNPRRRSMYIQIASAALACLSYVIAYPALALRLSLAKVGILQAVATVLLGVCAFAVAIWKARDELNWRSIDRSVYRSSPHPFVRLVLANNVYLMMSIVPWVLMVALVILWWHLCSSQPGWRGIAFSFRALNPASGVSPTIPIVCLLIGWYLWALLQTWRLRFLGERPFLPSRIGDSDADSFFVSDEAVYSNNARSNTVGENLSSLLFVRKLFLCKTRLDSDSFRGLFIDFCVVCVSIVLILFMAATWSPVRSIDHLVWQTGRRSSPFEVLFLGLLIPLVLVALSGWLRMLFIWIALRRDILEPLESQPIRDAFSRLEKVSLMTMLRQGNIEEHRQELARSKESIRQMLNLTELNSMAGVEADRRELRRIGEKIISEPALLPLRERGDAASTSQEIESRFAQFARLLLKLVLVPYWTSSRRGCVQSEQARPILIQEKEVPETIIIKKSVFPESPEHILVAEEFLALRYVSFIRAVLTNLRYVMMFVSAAFILAITAWNSYPFQPTQYGDWIFTGLLVLLGAGIVWVFAQMYRNPILSRITNTEPNELGWEFYARIAVFGALPVITWFAYQFPEIGGSLLKFVRPGLDVLK